MSWLDELQAGSQVFIDSRHGWNDRLTLATVDRVTRTQVVIEGDKWRKTDGRRVGLERSKWHVPVELVQVTPETKARFESEQAERRRKTLMRKVEQSLGGLPLDKVEAIYRIAFPIGGELVERAEAHPSESVPGPSSGAGVAVPHRHTSAPNETSPAVSERPDDATIVDVAKALRSIAADLRAAGDIPLVQLDENGVAPAAITLADELWLSALRLDPDNSCNDERNT